MAVAMAVAAVVLRWVPYNAMPLLAVEGIRVAAVVSWRISNAGWVRCGRCAAVSAGVRVHEGDAWTRCVMVGRRRGVALVLVLVVVSWVA